MSVERILRLALVALLAGAFSSALAGCGSCKKNQAPPEEQGSIFEDAGMSGPTNTQHGSRGKKTVTVGKEKIQKAYKGCKEMRQVLKGDLSTAEGTLWKIFEALLIPNDETAFETFFGYVDSDFQSRDSAKRYWFASARKHDSKNFLRLVFSKDDPSYMLCERRKEGDGWRIFVGKSPPVGSNPPYVLHKVEDKWLLKTFTPH